MKRFLALFLCVVVTLTLLPSAALAVETFTTSEEGIALIKQFEDFRSEPYQDDRGNWYIGYGLARRTTPAASRRRRATASCGRT